MAEILKFEELGSAAQEQFLKHARLLIDKNYVTDIALNKLAEQIYQNHMKAKIETQSENPPAPPRNTSFLDYDKDSVWATPEIKEDDNWLK